MPSCGTEFPNLRGVHDAFLFCNRGSYFQGLIRMKSQHDLMIANSMALITPEDNIVIIIGTILFMYKLSIGTVLCTRCR